MRGGWQRSCSTARMAPIHRKLSRRDALGTLGFAGAALASGCSSSAAASPSTTATSAAASTGNCAITPEETAGPYPDRLGMVNTPAFFRQDITEGRSGLPVTLALTVVNVAKSCVALAGAAVEIWQCDASGNYSEYAQPGYNGTGQTFLRGLQTTDASGRATFRTIYPGWYQGRATHIHVQVFVNGAVIKTTQIAFPEDVSAAVYRTSVYASHGQNTTSNNSDNVFADGTQYEMATLSGDAASGYTATLTIGVSG
jgi:protocatechuate 3,4-dioxygenase beta subunit